MDLLPPELQKMISSHLDLEDQLALALVYPALRWLVPPHARTAILVTNCITHEFKVNLPKKPMKIQIEILSTKWSVPKDDIEEAWTSSKVILSPCPANAEVKIRIEITSLGAKTLKGWIVGPCPEVLWTASGLPPSLSPDAGEVTVIF